MRYPTFKSWIDPIFGSDTEECYVLHEYAQRVRPGSYLLEVGVLAGKSLLSMMIDTPATVAIAIDPWDEFHTGWHLKPEDAYARMWANYGRIRSVYNLPKLHVFQGDSRDAVLVGDVYDAIGYQDYGFMFIDGDHTYEAVADDIKNYVLPLVPAGGAVGFHDYGNPDWQDVQTAVDGLLKGWHHETRLGYTLILRRPHE